MTDAQCKQDFNKKFPQFPDLVEDCYAIADPEKDHGFRPGSDQWRRYWRQVAKIEFATMSEFGPRYRREYPVFLQLFRAYKWD